MFDLFLSKKVDMRKFGIGMLTYQQLQDELISVFKKDYSQYKDVNPVSTILKSSINFIEWKYYSRYLAWLVISLLSVAFLYIPQEYFIVGLIAAFVWIVINSLCFYFFAGVPLLKHVKMLKDNVLLVSKECNKTEFNDNDVIKLLNDINRTKEIKSELLLQNYYDFVSPNFKEIKSKDEFSNPLIRLLCYQIINQVSKIPISDIETRLLLASLLRIGKTNLSSHVTKLNTINKLVSPDFQSILKNLSQKEIDSMKEDIFNAVKVLRHSCSEVESIYNKLDKVVLKEV